MDMCGGANTATADQPFGNMLPLLMMSGDKGKSVDPMMLMLMMSNGGGNTNMFSNPMMMYALMGDDSKVDPMMLFAMSGAFNAPHKCHKHNCGEGNCNG